MKKKEIGDFIMDFRTLQVVKDAESMLCVNIWLFVYLT